MKLDNLSNFDGFYKVSNKVNFQNYFVNKLILRKSPNWGMGPNFDVSAPPTFVIEFSNKLESLNIKIVAA